MAIRVLILELWMGHGVCNGEVRGSAHPTAPQSGGSGVLRSSLRQAATAPPTGGAARTARVSPGPLGLAPIGTSGEQVPERLPRMAGRQVEADPTELEPQPATDLEQPEA